jgi:hypothetical protein
MVALNADELGVLFATSGEARNLEQIYQFGHQGPLQLPLVRVAEAVRRLLENGMIEPVSGKDGDAVGDPDDPGLVWKGTFVITALGQECLTSQSQISIEMRPVLRKPRFGEWGDIAVDLPLEEFQANRREMGQVQEEAPGA